MTGGQPVSRNFQRELEQQAGELVQVADLVGRCRVGWTRDAIGVEPASVQAVAAAAGDVGGGLSPTRSTSARGGRPSRSNAASKIAGSGLAAPTSSEMITSAKQSRMAEPARRGRWTSQPVGDEREAVLRA